MGLHSIALNNPLISLSFTSTVNRDTAPTHNFLTSSPSSSIVSSSLFKFSNSHLILHQGFFCIWDTRYHELFLYFKASTPFNHHLFNKVMGCCGMGMQGPTLGTLRCCVTAGWSCPVSASQGAQNLLVTAPSQASLFLEESVSNDIYNESTEIEATCFLSPFLFFPFTDFVNSCHREK